MCPSGCGELTYPCHAKKWKCMLSPLPFILNQPSVEALYYLSSSESSRQEHTSCMFIPKFQNSVLSSRILLPCLSLIATPGWVYEILGEILVTQFYTFLHCLNSYVWEEPFFLSSIRKGREILQYSP